MDALDALSDHDEALRHLHEPLGPRAGARLHRAAQLLSLLATLGSTWCQDCEEADLEKSHQLTIDALSALPVSLRGAFDEDIAQLRGTAA